MNSPSVVNAALLVARILLSAIFIQAGFNKLVGYAASAGYMESMGVSAFLLPLVILLELGGGLAILVGFQTRIAAALIAGFCLLSALLFHMKAGDRNQAIHFMKNLSMAGGFLALFATGAGAWSLDGRRKS